MYVLGGGIRPGALWASPVPCDGAVGRRKRDSAVRAEQECEASDPHFLNRAPEANINKTILPGALLKGVAAQAQAMRLVAPGSPPASTVEVFSGVLPLHLVSNSSRMPGGTG
jgi:hypothetical protein